MKRPQGVVLGECGNLWTPRYVPLHVMANWLKRRQFLKFKGLKNSVQGSIQKKVNNCRELCAAL